MTSPAAPRQRGHRLQAALLILVGAGLALAGTTSHPDAIVPWVFGIVDGIDYADLWRPVYNPEPMDTYAYRPLSVLLIKVALALAGPDTVVLTLVHGLVLVAFGWVARGFLRRHGFDAWTATLASVSALMMPSLLFSAWICVEFDLVGATFVLAAASALQDERSGRGRHPGVFWLLAVLAMTTKETSALQLLAYLGALTLANRTDAALWKRSAAYVGLLLLVTAPMHLVDSGNTTAFTVWSDGFHPIRIAGMVLHTGAQLVFLVSAVGIVLLGTAAIRTVAPHRLPAALAVGTAGVFLGAPVLRHYSHFEAVIFSSGWWTVLCVAGLLVALTVLIRRTDGPLRVALLMVALTWAGFAAAPILLRFARADVSARIFAACVPVLHALVWRELWRGWRAEPTRTRRWRVLRAVLGLSFGLFVLSSAINTVTFHRVRLGVEAEAKAALVADLRMACPALINTNPVQLLTIAELRLLGATRLGQCAWVETTTAQPEPGMSLDELISSGGISADEGQDIYLYVQTARSTMTQAHGDSAASVGGGGARSRGGADTELADRLAGDFSWTQGLLPESDDDMFAAYQRMIYEIETDIEALFAARGWSVIKATSSYVQLPLWWNELPARLIGGVPIVETYDYVGRVYRIAARRPGWTPPGGRGRKDRSADRDRSPAPD